MRKSLRLDEMGSVFGLEFLRCRRMKRNEEWQTKSEGEEGWDVRWDVSCNMVKTVFFLPFYSPFRLPLLFKVAMHSRSLAQERNSQEYLIQAFQIIAPSREGERKRGSKKDGCTLQNAAVVTQERGMRAILQWHFSSLLTLHAEWWGSQAALLLLKGRLHVFVRAYVSSSHVLCQWFSWKEGSCCRSLCPLRVPLPSAHTYATCPPTSGSQRAAMSSRGLQLVWGTFLHWGLVFQHYMNVV